MTKTYPELMTLQATANAYISRQKTMNKLTYALKSKILPQIEKIVDEEDIASKAQDLTVEHASVDKDKNLIIQNGNYIFTKEARKMVDEGIRKINSEYRTKEFEITQYIVKDTEGLTIDEQFAFSGVCIEEINFENQELESANQNGQT